MAVEDGFISGGDEEEEITTAASPAQTQETTTTAPLNPKVEQLLALFPQSNSEIITLVLEHSNDNLEIATDTLLSMNDPNPPPPPPSTTTSLPTNQMDSDAAFARSLAAEEDSRAERSRRSQSQQQQQQSGNLAYQPYTPKRNRFGASNNANSNNSTGSASNIGDYRGSEGEPRPRDELDQLTEGMAKLAEHGSRYAEQGKKTLGSLFSKVKEQINKFEEQRQINNYNNNFNDDGESSARPLPPPPASGNWTPPSSRGQSSNSNATLPRTPTSPQLPKLPPIDSDKSSLPSLPAVTPSSPPSISSTIASTKVEPVSTPIEEPKKDFSKIGLLPRQSVSLLDNSNNKGGHESEEDEDDLEYVRSPFDED